MELWVEKYRPRVISDTILPQELKTTFQSFVDKKYVPNLLLTGRAGVGKTTVARAMLEECGFDYIVINGSMNGNIDTLRTDIRNFASSVSLTGGRKYVILDEADYLNAQSTQPALRNFMEEFSKNCGFILTCNFKNRIIEPLHSRCSVIEFKIPDSDQAKLAAQFFKRVQTILEAEGVEFDKKVVADLLKRYFPDWRRVINELQRYSANGVIDAGIMVNISDESFNNLFKMLKARDFDGVRKWVATNTDIDFATLARKLYDASAVQLKGPAAAQMIIHLGEYQDKATRVADQEINTMACLTEIMADCF